VAATAATDFRSDLREGLKVLGVMGANFLCMNASKKMGAWCVGCCRHATLLGGTENSPADGARGWGGQQNHLGARCRGRRTSLRQIGVLLGRISRRLHISLGKIHTREAKKPVLWRLQRTTSPYCLIDCSLY
jgi:hypothetical protein